MKAIGGLLLLFLCFIGGQFLPIEKCRSNTGHNEISSGELANSNSKTITDGTIRALLERFRSIAGRKQEIPETHYVYNTSSMLMDALITKGTVLNPNKFIIETVHANMDALNFMANISYPELKVMGNYGINMDNDEFHLIGNGSFVIKLLNFGSLVNITLGLFNNKTLFVKDFILDYNISVIQVHFDNLGGNEEVSHTLNDLINSALPDIIEVTKSDVQELAKSSFDDLASFLLTDMTVEQFVDLINSIAGSKMGVFLFKVQKLFKIQNEDGEKILQTKKTCLF